MEELIEELADWARPRPEHLRKLLLDFCKFPTERNRVYICGYVAGMSKCGTIGFDEARKLYRLLDAIVKLVTK